MNIWQKRNQIKHARLDFFFISVELMSMLSQEKILPRYRTDHSFLFLELQTDNFKKGKGFWLFNNSLLKDYDYALQIKNIISETQNEYKVNNPGESAFSINDSLFLEVLLKKLRSFTVMYL